jgi:hypothetical protein
VLFYADDMKLCTWFSGLLENSGRSEQAGCLVWNDLNGVHHIFETTSSCGIFLHGGGIILGRVYSITDLREL